MIARRLSWLLCAIALAPAATAARAQSADLREARTKGSATAPVTMYIMSDFECPFCGDFARRTFPEIEREYVTTGKIQVVFVNMPLTSLHKNAEPAAEVAMCAARQNKFWAMHDLLFRHQAQWADLDQPGSYFLTLGDSAALDRAELTTCLQSAATRPLVQADYEGSLRTGAHSTPSFYIEGGLMAGDQPMDVFRPILDSIIRTKAPHPAPSR